MENPRNKGYNPKDNKYYAYSDIDSNGNTHINIGPGLEKNGHPDIDYTRGYTLDEISGFARTTVGNRVDSMLKSLVEMENGKYKDIRDNLNEGSLLTLTDIAYNGRTARNRNLPESWPKLVNYIATGDLESAKNETYSGSTRRQQMRNDLLTFDKIDKNTVKNR